MRTQYRLIRTRLFHSLARFHSGPARSHLRSKSLVRARPSSVSRQGRRRTLRFIRLTDGKNCDARRTVCLGQLALGRMRKQFGRTHRDGFVFASAAERWGICFYRRKPSQGVVTKWSELFRTRTSNIGDCAEKSRRDLYRFEEIVINSLHCVAGVRGHSYAKFDHKFSQL
jgi:hypothetical protein